MGVSHFDALLVHDTDRFTHCDDQPRRFSEAIDGAFRALVRLREEGVTRAIGIGVNENDVCLQALRQVDIDCMFIAGTYNLLDRSAAEELLPECLDRGVAVINGRVFGSGILATGPTDGSRFNYSAAPAEVINRVRAIDHLCGEAGVELGALATQFAATHPAIASVCIGARTVNQQESNLRWMSADIPDDLWLAIADL